MSRGAGRTDCALCGLPLTVAGAVEDADPALGVSLGARVVASCQWCGWVGETKLGYRAPDRVRLRGEAARRKARRRDDDA